jgi:hypothetical protein
VLAHSIRGNPGGPALPDSPAEFAPPDWFALVWRGLRQRHSSD